jgi:hypothetical protein
MAHRVEAGQGTVEQLAGRAPSHVSDEPDTACVALASRVVEKALLVAHALDHLSGKEDESPASASMG